MATYIALVRKQPNSCFGVEFPDFPGCVSGGDTLDEAIASAHEALALHVRGILEDGDQLPAPSSIDKVLRRRASKGAVPTLVRLASVRGRSVRLNVTLEENLLREIDDAAAAKGMTRSAFLADAARQAIR